MVARLDDSHLRIGALHSEGGATNMMHAAGIKIDDVTHHPVAETEEAYRFGLSGNVYDVMPQEQEAAHGVIPTISVQLGLHDAQAMYSIEGERIAAMSSESKLNVHLDVPILHARPALVMEDADQDLISDALEEPLIDETTWQMEQMAISQSEEVPIQASMVKAKSAKPIELTRAEAEASLNNPVKFTPRSTGAPKKGNYPDFKKKTDGLRVGRKMGTDTIEAVDQDSISDAEETMQQQAALTLSMQSDVVDNLFADSFSLYDSHESTKTH